MQALLVIALSVFGTGLCLGWLARTILGPKARPPTDDGVRITGFYYAGRPLPPEPTRPDFENDPFFRHDSADDPDVERLREDCARTRGMAVTIGAGYGPRPMG
jgi:hypothetical protein